MPPEDGNDSDKDDGGSDDECSGNVRDLGKGVLSVPAEVRVVSHGEVKQLSLPEDHDLNQIISQPSEETPQAGTSQDKNTKGKRKHKERKWSDISFSNCTGKSTVNIDKISGKAEIDIANIAPVDMFKYIWNDSLIIHIIRETVKYAVMKGYPDTTISMEDIYDYLGILLLSGYVKLPSRRMYWETRPDSHNNLVASTMTRNKFETIHRFLHFNDNNTIDKKDKIYKVRPLFTHMNEKFHTMVDVIPTSYSIDEAMEPYFGHHSMKQFIRGKPIRFGFKLWCLASSGGYLIKFEPYTGRVERAPGETLGGTVTETLSDGVLPAGSNLYIDNYFTSLTLLETLASKNIVCFGTIRADRIEKAPLKDLKKTARGTSHGIRDETNKLALIRWNDNAQVTIATNSTTPEVTSLAACTRWSAKDKRKISTSQPEVIKMYNAGMGGVDLFDKMRGLYRIRIRSKKWYWPLFRFCLNGSIVNLWMLYRQEHKTISLLEFTRQIVTALLAGPKTGITKTVIPKLKGQVQNEIRYDRKDHLVMWQNTQRRCAYCGKCAKFICIKCNIGLHPDTCFLKYHTK